MSGAGRRRQTGYLHEVPLLFAAAGVLAALLPALPAWLARPLAVVLALLVGAALWYMLLAPGWLPDPAVVAPRWLRLLAFALLCAMIVLVTADFVFVKD